MIKNGAFMNSSQRLSLIRKKSFGRLVWECKTRLKRVLLGREHPVKVLALAAMINVKNRINSVKLKHMMGWLFAVNLGLGSAFAGAG